MELLVWGRAASQELARVKSHHERSGADEAQHPVVQHQLLSADRIRGFAAAGQCGGTLHLGCVKQKGYELYFLAALRNE